MVVFIYLLYPYSFTWEMGDEMGDCMKVYCYAIYRHLQVNLFHRTWFYSGWPWGENVPDFVPGYKNVSLISFQL